MKLFMTVLLIIAFFGAVYFSFIFIVGKTMQSQPTINVTETTSAWKTASEQAREQQQKQRDLMEQRKQRMRDLGHR